MRAMIPRQSRDTEFCKQIEDLSKIRGGNVRNLKAERC